MNKNKRDKLDYEMVGLFGEKSKVKAESKLKKEPKTKENKELKPKENKEPTPKENKELKLKIKI